MAAPCVTSRKAESRTDATRLYFARRACQPTHSPQLHFTSVDLAASRPVVVWRTPMRYLIAALAAVGFAASAGTLVLKNGDGHELRLYDTPCSHGETLGILKEEWRPKFRNARILNSKGFIEMYGCWLKKDEETAVVILSDGAAMELPLAAFTDPMI